MLGGLGDEIEITMVAETPDPVPSVHGQSLLVDRTASDGASYDLLFIPGDDTALDAAKRPAVTDWIVETAKQAELEMAVKCAASISLALPS